ncbi:MAG TPA: hypothetical protein VK195_17865 [Burkholderiaceae bacterium]|nr:hypothetical protein [Burkholderiaceae bacterium]
MRRIRTHTGLVLAGLALLGPARAELVEIRWDAAGRFERLSDVDQAAGRRSGADALPAKATLRRSPADGSS